MDHTFFNPNASGLWLHNSSISPLQPAQISFWRRIRGKAVKKELFLAPNVLQWFLFETFPPNGTKLMIYVQTFSGGVPDLKYPPKGMLFCCKYQFSAFESDPHQKRGMCQVGLAGPSNTTTYPLSERGGGARRYHGELCLRLLSR